MTNDSMRLDEIKRKVRKLKKIEEKIRFNGNTQPDNKLIWNHFFKLRETNNSRAKYSLQMLASMSSEEYKNVINEYFSLVYYELYKVSEITGEKRNYDPALLSRLGLPSTAEKNDIKKRFRELAKKYHPDSGGDAVMFIELMDNYKKLLGE